jgi:serine/threonine-protein kinase HipA
MTDALAVVLEDVVAGELVRLRGGRLRFDYRSEYQQRAAATPLSVSMPVAIASHPDRFISPWLWGLLPDNDAVLQRWAREFHASASSPFSLLGTPIGEDCAGAVRFSDPSKLERVLRRSGEVAWLTDADIAQRLRDLRQDTTAWLGRSFTGQFSLAGAQAKTALILQDGRWGVPSGAAPTTHILKPAVGGLDDHDLNEHLCLDAARRAGLIAARTTVRRFGDEGAVVVARYDRQVLGDGRIVRVHQEDLCQALSVPPSRKYQSEGGPSPAGIARLLRSVMAPRAGEEAVARFADALIWNWLIAGTDAHAKNYSLLLAGDQVRLAPLYDVASALPYGVDEHKLRFAMKLGGSYEVHVRSNPWPRTARELALDPGVLEDRVRALATAGAAAFAEAAAAPDVASLGLELAGRLVDLVAERCERCLAVLSSSTSTGGPR